MLWKNIGLSTIFYIVQKIEVEHGNEAFLLKMSWGEKQALNGEIHENFMFSCIKHACFQAFSPFSAYFSPHDIIAEIISTCGTWAWFTTLSYPHVRV